MRTKVGFTAMLLLLGACPSTTPGDDDVDATPPADARLRPDASCSGVVEPHMLVPGVHVADGTAITWSSNPPTSGNHYGSWARWGETYTNPLDRGNWVHNLEHGGVVIAYNCPGGCADELAQLEELLAALPQDPICTGGIRTRTLITADPLLPAGVRFAASAWDMPSSFGWTWTAACVDTDTLSPFVSEHYGKGPEAVCAQGTVP